MPSYRCKKCGAVWYDWEVGKICQKYGGKLELVSESAATKKQGGG